MSRSCLRRSRPCGCSAGDVWRKRSDLLVFAAGHLRGVSAAVFRWGTQSIYRNFTGSIILSARKKLAERRGIVTLPTKSPNLRVHHIHATLALEGQHSQSAAQRSKLPWNRFVTTFNFGRAPVSRGRSGPIVPAVPVTPERTMDCPASGMIKRFVGARRWSFVYQPSFAKEQVKAG